MAASVHLAATSVTMGESVTRPARAIESDVTAFPSSGSLARGPLSQAPSVVGSVVSGRKATASGPAAAKRFGEALAEALAN